ncbi:hypothetical protein [Chitinibacter sp. GC72]|uniref:ORC-CDC6 family AAA ATPase n=1 Tax=Chitinibacter sp. GC72 TaxID=1526917 RepID=UPI0018DF5243|nr:hypothetical protein [Chitinibacter sp. GC72]
MNNENRFYLRTESIKPEEILQLSVMNSTDEQIVKSLKLADPCLLEGSRGTGKSFLMKIAELQIEVENKEYLPVFVSFNISSLITTNDPLQFYHWMLAKTLKALTNKLRKNGLVVSTYTANLLSNDESSNNDGVEKNLRKIVTQFEESYKDQGNINLAALPDIEDVKDAIEHICKENKLQRIYFFFDEAAHVFRPEQQRQFFSLFKDLRSPYITCNAAIYPGVTYFGDSFEPTHDCIYRKIDRNIKDSNYLSYFKEIVDKQADPQLKNAIDSNLEIFNTLAFSCGGNPRILLKTIQEMERFNTSSINKLIKDFYRGQIWSEHTELGDKYKGHKKLIDWGRDFLEKQVIPAIERLNSNRKEKEQNESSIYFWIHKDAPESVKESLRLLTYTGIVKKVDSSIRATRSELGVRYEVKYGCIIALESNPHTESIDFYKSLSLKKFPEFGRTHAAYDDIKDISTKVINEISYKESLNSMLSKSIDVLEMLTDWQKSSLKKAGILTIEDLHSNTEESLIQKIYNVGTVRARLMKNAATAELLEYLSG